MTATVTYLDGSPVPQSEPWSPGDYEQRAIGHTPGTLWERAADSAPSASLRRGLQESARGEVVDLGDFTQYVDRSALDRYAVLFGLGHNAGRSAYDTMRRAFDEQSALERAKAAHPAGKGRTVRDDFWHLDGQHRTSAPTANGRDVTRFERGIRAHLDSCVKLAQETTNADDNGATDD